MQCRRRWLVAAAWSLLGLGCGPSERIEPEVRAAREEAAPNVGAQASRNAELLPATTASLPVVGDPLGLLSKKPKGAAGGKANPSKLDPGALSSSGAKPQPSASLERDPRAVARGASTIIDRRAPTTIRDVDMTYVRNAVLARPQPHVLFLYGAYCPACRNVMPKFVDAVRGYGGPAGITAVSIDDSREAFSAYIPALGGVIEPLLLTREGAGLRKEAEKLGMTWADGPPDMVSIPRIAVFDARGRVVRQGGSNEVARLAKTLREL